MKVFSIAPGLSFVDHLAEGLLQRAGGDPLKLSAVTVLLPTRRSIRSLKEAFLRRLGQAGQDGALLLPRMMTLGDLDEDELLLSGGFSGTEAPAIDPLRRRLMLARLVLAARPGLAWDQAALLADELGRFLDQMQTQGTPLERLQDLVPADYAQHWGAVLEFLNILADAWPRVLAEEKAVDPATRRNRLLAGQARVWAETPPADPIIAAGSTGSIPATAALLKVVAALPNGAVILPGLDRLLDDEAWEGLDDGHPQFGLKKLLEGFGLDRHDVADWDTAKSDVWRQRLLSECFRPAAASEAWRTLPAFPAQAARGLSYLEAADPRTEALAIALLLREAAERPGETAALVTPDRDLARRVASELERFGIVIDDSAGQPLSKTTPGVFLRLAAQAPSRDFAPFDLLALLKHPLAGLGLAPGRLRHLARSLELDRLRGPRPAPGLAPLLPGHPWLKGLEEASACFLDLLKGGNAPLADLARAHIRLAESLAATSEESGADRLWEGEAGQAAAGFLARLLAASADLGAMPGAAYPALFDTLMQAETVRPAFGRHPRLHIWGPLEARLQGADLLILGGMNEGVWPADPPADPWLSRPMRKRLGLDSPERRVGMAAHDLAQALASPRVVISRAARAEGAPTQPSRFLQRLETVMRAAGLLGEGGGEGWRLQAPVDWAAAIDHAEKLPPLGPPAPCPPLAARPTGLSVTRVETWMRDPYALYAGKILKLRALDPVDADPSAAEYGDMIHKALELYVKRWPKTPPADPGAELVEIGRQLFADKIGQPGVWAFWWPRFLSVAGFVAAAEAGRAGLVAERFAEISGRIELDGFELTAKADRIDRLRDGRYALIDYKTGAPPSWKQLAAGFAPQLPLEAAMLMAGGFQGLKGADIAEMGFWRLSGGPQGGKAQMLDKNVAELAERALEGLKGLIRAYRDPNSRYPACPTPGQEPGWSDYVHLERRLEWQSEEDAS